MRLPADRSATKNPSVRSILLLAAVCFHAGSFGQTTFLMSDGSGTGCQGVLYDSGGQGATGYSNYEDYTFTICPDSSGSHINLWAVSFNLDVSETPLDYLMIFDGPTVAAPLLGTYTGEQFENVTLAATEANTSGCLTLRFHSYDQGTGTFAIAFMCDQQACTAPSAIASMSESSPASICAGEVLTFDGSASFAAPGQELSSYQWTISGNQSTVLQGAIVDHVFDEPGPYDVDLVVVDDIGCPSSDTVHLHVDVGLSPVFQGMASNTHVCVGQELLLVADPVPQAFAGYPSIDYGEGFYIPDIQAQQVGSTIEVHGYPEGSTVTSVDDILSMCMDIEHSFMGDLVLRLACPDGSTVTLHEQGGGGTHLGGAQDFDTDSLPELGECWTYCWSPTATNGTWAMNMDNTIIAGTPPGSSLIPGTYEPVSSFSAMVGCPLNGPWTLSAVDLWAADNGFVCGWEIVFSELPDLDTSIFIPTFGEGCDSSYWSGDNLIWTSPGCDSALFLSNNTGTYPVNYSVVDNAGCSADTTITITVIEPLEFAALPDLVQCSDTLSLHADVNIAAAACEWQLVMHKLSFPYQWGSSSLLVSVGDTTYTYQCTDTTQVVQIQMHTGDSVHVQFVQDAPESNVYFELFDHEGEVVATSGGIPTEGPVWSGTCDCGDPIDVVWQWDPAAIFSDPSVAEPLAWVNGTTQVTCSVHLADQPACQATGSFSITQGTDLSAGLDTTVAVCENSSPFALIDALGGQPVAGGYWTYAGDTVGDVLDPASQPPGTYTYSLTSTDGCLSSAALQLQILSQTDTLCVGIGIQDPALLSAVLYPQPTNDVLYLDGVPVPVVFSIIDPLGREIRRGRLSPNSGRIRLDVAELPTSLYVMRIYSDRGSLSLPWIKN